MAYLTFGGNRLTFGANPLIFGTAATAPRGDDAQNPVVADHAVSPSVRVVARNCSQATMM